METRSNAELKLDFEDLVEELNRFEQDARALQDRISQFMDSARQAIEDATPAEPPADVDKSVEDSRTETS